MSELLSLVMVALADVYNTVDWSRASDLMSFVNETLGTYFIVASQQNDDKKDDRL